MIPGRPHGCQCDVTLNFGQRPMWPGAHRLVALRIAVVQVGEGLVAGDAGRDDHDRDEKQRNADVRWEVDVAEVDVEAERATLKKTTLLFLPRLG